jgi:hypothetical protein
MTLREPLVIINGQIQQLPSGDTINGAGPGGTFDGAFDGTNNEGSPITIGQPVYIDADDSVKLLSANSANSVKFAGLVGDASIGTGNTGNIQYTGELTANVSQWTAVGIPSGNLTAGATYYVDDAATGNLTATAPTTVASYVIPVGVSVNVTTLKLFDKTIVKL